MKNSKIAVKNDKIISASVPVYFFKAEADNAIYAQCPALGIITSGKSLSKSKAMFNEAFSLWLEYVNNSDKIAFILKNLGWQISKTSIIPKSKPYEIPIRLIDSKTVEIKVPVEFIN